MNRMLAKKAETRNDLDARHLRGDPLCELKLLVVGRGGAGKTTLVKGIAEGFQAAEGEDVTSPTFTLVHEYHGPSVNLFHIDLYRVDTERQLLTLGLDDLLDANNILLIEWGEKFERFRQERDVEITIRRAGESGREISVNFAGDP